MQLDSFLKFDNFTSKTFWYHNFAGERKTWKIAHLLFLRNRRFPPWLSGRAFDFGSEGPDGGGLLRGQGSKFFFSFFSSKFDACCHLVAKLSISNVFLHLYTQEMGLKTVFFNLLSLSITEMVEEVSIFHLKVICPIQDNKIWCIMYIAPISTSQYCPCSLCYVF